VCYSQVSLIANKINLSEMVGSVHAGAVDKKWVEEDGVSSLHGQMNSGHGGVVVLNAMVHLVHSALHNTNDTISLED
jgi:hypothetical protein